MSSWGTYEQQLARETGRNPYEIMDKKAEEIAGQWRAYISSVYGGRTISIWDSKARVFLGFRMKKPELI